MKTKGWKMETGGVMRQELQLRIISVLHSRQKHLYLSSDESLQSAESGLASNISFVSNNGD